MEKRSFEILITGNVLILYLKRYRNSYYMNIILLFRSRSWEPEPVLKFAWSQSRKIKKGPAPVTLQVYLIVWIELSFFFSSFAALPEQDCWWHWERTGAHFVGRFWLTDWCTAGGQEERGWGGQERGGGQPAAAAQAGRAEHNQGTGSAIVIIPALILETWKIPVL